MSTTVFEFGSVVKDFGQFSIWLKNKNLIKSEILCGKCVRSMKEVAGKRLWICSKRGLHPSGKLVRESQLKGTLFEGAGHWRAEVRGVPFEQEGRRHPDRSGEEARGARHHHHE